MLLLPLLPHVWIWQASYRGKQLTCTRFARSNVLRHSCCVLLPAQYVIIWILRNGEAHLHHVSKSAFPHQMANASAICNNPRSKHGVNVTSCDAQGSRFESGSGLGRVVLSGSLGKYLHVAAYSRLYLPTIAGRNSRTEISRQREHHVCIV